MFQITGTLLGLDKVLFWLAQAQPGYPTTINPVQPGVPPSEVALAFSGPRFWVAWIAGVVLAFGIQFALTNLGVAFGLSLLGGQSHSSGGTASHEVGSFGGTIRKIGTALGIGTLVSVTFSLGAACYMAVKLTLLYGNVFLGTVIGLVIWATYFVLVYWGMYSVGSRGLGSLLGSVVNTASSGLQMITGTLAAAIGARTVKNQVVSTAEAAAAAVSREIGSAIDPASIREKVEEYIEAIRPPELDLGKIRQEFENMLNTPEVKALAKSGDLRQIDRQKFVDLVSSRTDLSKRDINRIVDQLERVWRQVVDQQISKPDRLGELTEYLKSVQSGQLNSNEFNQKLDELIAEVRASRESAQQQQDQQTKTDWLQNPLSQALNTLMGIALGRVDLSDLDIEKILRSLTQAREKLATAKDQVTQQAEQLASQTGMKTPTPLRHNTIKADVENYLLNTYSWQMSREKLAEDFRHVLYDPEADPDLVRRQLEQISRNDFVQILEQKGLLTQAKIQEIADQAESIRQEVLATVTTAADQEAAKHVRRRVEQYLLRTNKDELSEAGIERNFKPLLEDPDAEHDTLNQRLAQFDRNTFRQILSQRLDISPSEVEPIIDRLERSRDSVLFESQAAVEQARQKAESLWLNLESYLRNTGKEELNPEGIKRDLQTLLDDPQAGVAAVRARLSRFDRDTLVQLLSQRQDLSEEQVNQVLNQVEAAWHGVQRTPQVLAQKAGEQYDQVTNAIAEYLRNTGKDELNPEGIKRDLATLLENPQLGIYQWRQRLSQIDRDTIVKLLAQRQDLSEEQVNQIIDQVQDSIRNFVRAPRRLATRTQARVQNFRANLEEYLRNSGKEELNPEGIKRDLQLLLNDPRAGVESLTDRLAHFDRSTIVTLLQARPDMSEEEANRIVDSVLSVRDSFVEQVRSIQRRIQDVVDGIFARIRNYLNSLERPELNYDGIKRDLRQLFSDPQAGFEALRDRLSSFNRDTLVAVLSSREDISEADANRIIDQIEGARNTVLQRAERIQQEAQRRLEEVKLQAQRQADETRKAAASAAWWLFATALVSFVISGTLGAIAVITA